MWDSFVESFITDKGYINVLSGLGVTIVTAVVALILGIVLGTLAAFVELQKSKHWTMKILKGLTKAYVGFFRGTPIVVQLLFIYFVIFPAIGLGMLQAEIVGVIIFGLNSGAYVSEIMRGGILSVDQGQTEAGRSLGLTGKQTMLSIVIPQAIKNVVPMLANEFIALLKDSSVLSFIGVMDITKAFREIGAENYEYTIPYLILAAAYLILVLLVTWLVKLLERRLRRSDRG